MPEPEVEALADALIKAGVVNSWELAKERAREMMAVKKEKPAENDTKDEVLGSDKSLNELLGQAGVKEEEMKEPEQPPEESQNQDNTSS